MLSHFSRVRLFATPWTAACQAALSMGISRQEYWSGLPLPPPGIEPVSLLAGRFFTTSATWEALETACQCRAHGLDPWSRKITHALGQLSPRTYSRVLWNKRSQCDETPTLSATREGTHAVTKTQCHQNKHKYSFLKKKKWRRTFEGVTNWTTLLIIYIFSCLPLALFPLLRGVSSFHCLPLP